MENIKLVDDWRDKMLGDINDFSKKKYKPVGMHHLTRDIANFVGMKNLIKLSYFPFYSKEYKVEGKLAKLSHRSKLLTKIMDRISTIEDNENKFSKEVKAVIVYILPIPKVVFMQDIDYIKRYINELQTQKRDIDKNLLYALAKYGYWGIAEGELQNRFFGELDKNKILSASNLGEIAPNGFFITSDNGPKIFASYMLTNAPLKMTLDKPSKVCDEQCEKTIANSTDYIKFYKETYGLKKTVKDSVKSIISDNHFGEFISFCHNCTIGDGLVIDLKVKDPALYKETLSF